MNEQLRQNKQHIRAFLRTEIWSDEKLCALLAHAQDKLSMWSCCCLVGFPTADHAYRGKIGGYAAGCEKHYYRSWMNPVAERAELAFGSLGGNPTTSELLDDPFADERRRRLIRPIIRAELRRRQRARESAELAAHVLSGCTIDTERQDVLAEAIAFARGNRFMLPAWGEASSHHAVALLELQARIEEAEAVDA